MWFTCALGAAFFFGLRSILYQWSSQRRMDRNLLFAMVYIGSTILMIGVDVWMQSDWNQATLLGIVMGLFSCTANTCLYKGYAVGRASVIGFFSGLTPVLVTVAAAWLWQEKLAWMQWVGLLIVVGSLFIVRYTKELQQGQYTGWQWGLLAIVGYSLTDLTSKQALFMGASIIPTLTVMFLTSSVLFTLSYLHGKWRQREGHTASASTDDSTRTKQPKTNSWTFFSMLRLGVLIALVNVIAMMLKLAAFDGGITGVASAIMALSVVVVLVYARFYLKESWRPLEVYGVLLALLGVVIMKVF